MTTDQYEKTCALTKNIDNLKDDDLEAYLAIGLSGEVGEVQNLIKKKKYYPGYNLDETALKDELGDCLYYLTNLASFYGYSLKDIMQCNSVKVKNILDKKTEQVKI